MANTGQQLEELETIIQDFREIGKKMVFIFNESADKVDKHHKNVKITKIVVDGTGIIGTTVSIIGLALVLPTGGLSMIMVAAGGALAIASGATHLGSDITEHILTKSHIEKLAQLCLADEANILRLNGYLKKVAADLKTSDPDCIMDCATGFRILNVISGTARLTCSVVRVTRVASSTFKVVRVLGHVSYVLGGVSLVGDVIDLAINIHGLHKGQASKISAEFRRIAEELDIQARNIDTYFRNTTHHTH